MIRSWCSLDRITVRTTNHEPPTTNQLRARRAARFGRAATAELQLVTAARFVDGMRIEEVSFAFRDGGELLVVPV